MKRSKQIPANTKEEEKPRVLPKYIIFPQMAKQMNRIFARSLHHIKTLNHMNHNKDSNLKDILWEGGEFERISKYVPWDECNKNNNK